MNFSSKHSFIAFSLIIFLFLGITLSDSSNILADDSPVETTATSEPTLIPEIPTDIPQMPSLTPDDSTHDANPTEEPEIGLSQTPATESGFTETPQILFTETPTETLTITPSETPTLTPTATPEEGMYWSLKVDAIRGNSSLLSEFQAQGLESELTAQGSGMYSLSISGNDGVEDIREALYDVLADNVNFIGVSAEVLIEMPLESTDSIRIDLESNPSTGYGWEVLEATSEGVGMESRRDYAGRGGIGTPDRVTFTLKPDVIGEAAIHLVYMRNFMPDEAITRHLTIQFSQTENEIDLSDPHPAEAILAEEALQAMGVEEDTFRAQTDLPAAFDWRVGDATHPAINIPIRNQGSCGSCWAFGTVGVMEAAMVKAGMPVTNLSEQFLVSCNKDGWSCNGGWIAHKYHTNTLGKNQNVIGAVLENDMPYTATNGTCSIISNHPYKLSSYSSASGPSIATIKSMIYNYGPVFATVCTGDAFHAYYSWYSSEIGIFSTNESSQCGSDGTNHVVNLVGWNDAGGYWILRNSWDTWWGEDGYMRIAYGTSNVGKNISWATFTTPPAAIPVMTYPGKEALTNDNTINFTWESSVNAVSYEIQIANNTTFSESTIVQRRTGITGLSYAASALSDGIYYWRVRGRNIYNSDGKWSAYRAFTVDTTPPPTPKLSKPLTSTTVIGTPTFTWAKSSTAVYYQFQYGVSTNYNSYVYRSDQTTKLSHKPILMAPKVQYYWFVRASDKAGNWSEWSVPNAVIIEPTIPLKPVLNTPAKAVFIKDNTPDLAWNGVDYGVDYHVQVSKSSKFSLLVPSAVDQEGVTAINFTTGILSDGKYYWRVQARNVNGVYGPWCSVRYFTVDTLPPDPPMLVSPLTNITKVGTPTFSWKASPGASKYQFAYNTSGSTSAFNYTSDVLSVLSFRPPTMAPNTQYYWFVRALDRAGNWSNWSNPSLVYIEPTLPTKVELLSPANSIKISSTTPTLTWKAVTYGYIYQIQIDNNSRFDSVDFAYDSTVGATSMNVGPLGAGRWYWRVRALNVNGAIGPWSSYRYFTITP